MGLGSSSSQLGNCIVMSARPLIVVTNDDGYNARGIQSVCETLSEFAGNSSISRGGVAWHVVCRGSRRGCRRIGVAWFRPDPRCRPFVTSHVRCRGTAAGPPPDVLVIAPKVNQSAKSYSLSLDTPLAVEVTAAGVCVLQSALVRPSTTAAHGVWPLSARVFTSVGAAGV